MNFIITVVIIPLSDFELRTGTQMSYSETALSFSGLLSSIIKTGSEQSLV